MLNKNDCMNILLDMEERGIDIGDNLKKVATDKDVPMDVLKFIINNKGIEVVEFYEMLRKKHNQKKSSLYVNILKDKKSMEEKITMLVCLLTQIVLYGNKLSDTDRIYFWKETRASEISSVLSDFFCNDFGDENLIDKILQAIKTDLLVIEYLDGRRELN